MDENDSSHQDEYNEMKIIWFQVVEMEILIFEV